VKWLKATGKLWKRESTVQEGFQKKEGFGVPIRSRGRCRERGFARKGTRELTVAAEGGRGRLMV